MLLHGPRYRLAVQPRVYRVALVVALPTSSVEIDDERPSRLLGVIGRDIQCRRSLGTLDFKGEVDKPGSGSIGSASRDQQEPYDDR